MFARAGLLGVLLLATLPSALAATGLDPLLTTPSARAVVRAYAAGQSERAVALAGAALAEEGVGQDARGALEWLRAMSLERLGPRPPAIEALEALDGRAPPGLSAQSAWHLGRLLAAEGRMEDARAPLSRVPLESRFGVDARRLLVSALLDRGEVAEACRLAASTATHLLGHSREAEAQLVLARCREREAAVLARAGAREESRERLAEAAGVYRLVAGFWPEQPAAAQAREAAARLAERGVQARAVDGAALVARAERLRSHAHPRRFLSAARRMRLLLADTPKDPAAHELDLLSAEAAVRLRRFREAARWLGRVRNQGITSEHKARAAVGLARLRARWNGVAAAEAYEAVADTWPDAEAAALALFEAGELLRRRGDPRGDTLFLRCVAGWPDAPDADRCRWGLAWTAWRRGDTDAALGWLEPIVAEPEPAEDDVAPPPEDLEDAEASMADAATVEGASAVDDGEAQPPDPGVHVLDRRYLLERARYWHGRLLEARGDPERARAAYRRIALEHPYAFYSSLAWERLHALGDPAAPPAPEDPGLLELPILAAPHPEVAAAESYLRLGLVAEARATLRPLRREQLSVLDRRIASRLWLALGDVRRSHRVAPVPWEGGLPAMPRGEAALDARLAYPRPFAEVVGGEARHPDVDPNLLYALMRAESGFQPDARSPAGALGLTQVIRATGKRVAHGIGLTPFQHWMLREPEIAVRIGSAYLAWLLETFHRRLPLAIAAYNAGERAVTRWIAERGQLPVDAFIEEIPYAETSRYVRKVLSFYAVYRALDGELERPLGLDPTETVWLRRPGEAALPRLPDLLRPVSAPPKAP